MEIGFLGRRFEIKMVCCENTGSMPIYLGLIKWLGCYSRRCAVDSEHREEFFGTIGPG